MSELQRLLNASVDGLLAPEEEAALAELLRRDASAQRQYLQFMQLHAELHWSHGAAAALLVESSSVTGDVVPITLSQQPNGRGIGYGSWMTLALVVAAGLLLMASVIFMQSDHRHPDGSPPLIATIESVHGAVIFRSADAERRLTAGDSLSLPAGSLILEGDAAAVQCRFFDDTRLALSGDGEARLSDDGQKHVRLSRGLLTAEVSPQTPGRPMIIETPTARVEVLGTVLTLSAEAERTSVRVDSGRVRLSRLVDGRAVEIDRDHACVASIDPREDLRPQPTPNTADIWRHVFNEPPPDRWRGQWIAGTATQPSRVRAVPLVAGRREGAEPLIHFGITARRLESVDLGRVPADGMLRMRYRMAKPAPLRIMLGTNRPDGRFGGNFEAKLSSTVTLVDGEQWQLLELPLSRLKPLVPKFPAMAQGDRPSLILITTFDDDAGLEVAELSIIAVQEQRE